MPEAERREALYGEARGELQRMIERDGLERLHEHERRTEVARCVRVLTERWPGLDGQLSRRLLADALAEDDGPAELAQAEDAPASGHANVTTLRRDHRESVR